MRYGTVPLVRATGGLADTVVDFDAKTGKGNGFVFSEYTPGALVRTIRRAIDVHNNKKLWRKLQLNGMACNFSWKSSAKKYIELYKTANRKTAAV